MLCVRRPKRATRAALQRRTRRAAVRRFLVCAVLAALGSCLARSPTQAQSIEDFYKGKTLRIVIGYGPGTGYDFYLRALAAHIGAHIPGKPNVVPEYMPGAASLTMANYLYNVAPRDGTVIGLPERNLIVEPLFGDTLAKFDALKFSWLGSLSRTTALCFTWHTSGIRTLDDAKTRKVLLGSTGPSSGTTIFPHLLNKLFGTQFEPLIGYPDSGAIGIAMQNGEVQGYCGFTLAATKSAHPDWLDKHEVDILAQLTLKPSAELPSAPLIMDFAKDEATREALTLAFADQEIGFPVAAPPDIPADRLAALRKAFDETLEDPAFQKDAKQLSIDLIDPVNADRVGEVIRLIYATPPNVVETVRAIREGK
jgi:tripartite-type tricarboxylate transporter receptor subunit TctC